MLVLPAGGRMQISVCSGSTSLRRLFLVTAAIVAVLIGRVSVFASDTRLSGSWTGTVRVDASAPAVPDLLHLGTSLHLNASLGDLTLRSTTKLSQGSFRNQLIHAEVGRGHLAATGEMSFTASASKLGHSWFKIDLSEGFLPSTPTLGAELRGDYNVSSPHQLELELSSRTPIGRLVLDTYFSSDPGCAFIYDSTGLSISGTKFLCLKPTTTVTFDSGGFEKLYISASHHPPNSMFSLSLSYTLTCHSKALSVHPTFKSTVGSIRSCADLTIQKSGSGPVNVKLSGVTASCEVRNTTLSVTAREDSTTYSASGTAGGFAFTVDLVGGATGGIADVESVTVSIDGLSLGNGLKIRSLKYEWSDDPKTVLTVVVSVSF